MTQQKTTVKEQVLEALAKKPGQTAKQLHSSLKNEFGVQFPTYQAVHKTLKQLELVGDVSVLKNHYELSSIYTARVEAHLQDIKQSRGPGRISLLDLKPNEGVSIEFDEAIVVPYYWLLNEFDRLERARGASKKVVIVMNGVWPISILTDKEFEILQRVFSNTDLRIHLIPFKGDKNWNQLFLGLWKQVGAKISKLPKNKIPTNIDLVIAHDLVVQIEMEDKIIVGFNNVLRSILPHEFLARAYKYMFTQKGRIKIHVTRDVLLADHYYQSMGK